MIWAARILVPAVALALSLGTVKAPPAAAQVRSQATLHAVLDFRFVPAPSTPAGFTLGDLGLEMVATNDRGSTQRVAIGGDRVRVAAAPGTYRARFVAPRGAGAEPFTFRISDAEAPQQIALRPATLVLAMRDAAGRPAPGAVTWRLADQRGRAVAVPGTGPQVTVLLPPGQFRVAAVVGTVDVAPQQVALAFGQRAALEFTMTAAAMPAVPQPSPPHPRRGLLLLAARDAAGRAVADGASFIVEPVAGGEPDQSAETARQRRLVPGRYRVTPRFAGAELPAITVTIDADDRVTVAAVLPPPVLAVEVVDAKGQPIAADDKVFEVARLKPDGSLGPAQLLRGARLAVPCEAGAWRVRVYTATATGQVDVAVPVAGHVSTLVTVR